jgi:beta-N-acetylhexosaminidase
MRRIQAGAAVATVAMVLLGTPVPAGAATTAQSRAAAAYARMTVAQRIGQLFMVGAPSTGASASRRATLAKYDVGNVLLLGASTGGVSSVAAAVAPLRRTTTQASVRPFVAVDQEGGYVQHLKGSGFSRIPTALSQGRMSTSTLRSSWAKWAGQLRRAGINLDLAPVADVVPSSVGTRNQPIGRYYREYGYTPGVVGPHVVAALRGIHDAHIGATVKHFPGLGRATGNTDTTKNVTDPTRRNDPYLRPFASAVSAGVPVVMVSTAIYPNIDPHRIAAFSHLITTQMLRHDLGFTGLIASDDLLATSVSGYSYTSRAVLALDAGVDVLVVSTTAPLATMTSAIRSRMRSSKSFAAVVKAAVMRVLTAKAKAGLLPS